MATNSRKTSPTWMVVGALVILIPLLIWALRLAMSLVYAVGIGLLVAIAVLVIFFIWIKDRLDAGR